MELICKSLSIKASISFLGHALKLDGKKNIILLQLRNQTFNRNSTQKLS